jgi:L-alanine-DL-glutamate epimerase-like enolase superfamily enzyme
LPESNIVPRVLSVTAETFPIAGTFTISRGSKTEARVLTCSIVDGGFVGKGECVPYQRYGETMDSVRDQIESVARQIAAGADRMALRTILPAGAARNAVDCALWDLEAKIAGKPVVSRLGLGGVRALETAFTLSLDTPDAMAAQARANAKRPLLKIKLGGDGDVERMQAVAEAAPQSRIIVDANEGWNLNNIAENLDAAKRFGIALIEQPLPAGDDAALRDMSRVVPICADESVHDTASLDRLVGLYDAINIKLDKTGGLTEALELKAKSRQLGFSIMVGCMVGSSLAMAPAVLLAQDAEFVDLDGPLLLARDREPGLRYEGSLVSPPEPALWG